MAIFAGSSRKGPPDFSTYMEGVAVHECGVIMAETVNPPSTQQYDQMQADFAREYPECWPLQYQHDDRFRHEQLAEALRKAQKLADQQTYQYGYIYPTEEGSPTFDPNYPFVYILWQQ